MDFVLKSTKTRINTFLGKCTQVIRCIKKMNFLLILDIFLFSIVYLTGSNLDKNQHFRRFVINAESADDPGNFSPQRVGTFQLFGDSLSKFNEDCVNTVSDTNDVRKTEVFLMWTAPPAGSGCVIFR